MTQLVGGAPGSPEADLVSEGLGGGGLQPGFGHELSSKFKVFTSGPVQSIRIGSSLSDAERQIILTTLDHCGGDKKKAASVLGISLKTLYNRLNLYAAV